MGASFQAVVGAIQAVLTTPSFNWSALGLAALLLFRPQLRGLLGRATSVGPTGITAAPESVQQQAAPEDGGQGALTPATPAALRAPDAGPQDPHEFAEQLLANFYDPYVQSQEDSLRELLAAARIGLDTPDGRRVLLRHTAGWYVLWELQSIYQVIFGSQIALLRAVNAFPAARDDVAAAYAETAGRFPEFYEHYPLDAWLGYVLSQGLIEAKQEDGLDDQAAAVTRFHITPKGRTFLRYLVNYGKSDKGF
jgi:hypothetical protein